ncbi:MAG: hypothetical protein L3J49_06060 [Desulfobulbaceae bacterium]|nr:hypothetical protein [Desulfobulbaceae bacterium]
MKKDSEITVNVAFGDHDGLTAAICIALAEKLMGDELFQGEIMGIVVTED